MAATSQGNALDLTQKINAIEQTLATSNDSLLFGSLRLKDIDHFYDLTLGGYSEDEEALMKYILFEAVVKEVEEYGGDLGDTKIQVLQADVQRLSNIPEKYSQQGVFDTKV